MLLSVLTNERPIYHRDHGGAQVCFRGIAETMPKLSGSLLISEQHFSQLHSERVANRTESTWWRRKAFTLIRTIVHSKGNLPHSYSISNLVKTWVICSMWLCRHRLQIASLRPKLAPCPKEPSNRVVPWGQASCQTAREKIHTLLIQSHWTGFTNSWEL